MARIKIFQSGLEDGQRMPKISCASYEYRSKRPRRIQNFKDAVILFRRSRPKSDPSKLQAKRKDIQARINFERRRVLGRITNGQRLTGQEIKYAQRSFGIIFFPKHQPLRTKR